MTEALPPPSSSHSGMSLFYSHLGSTCGSGRLNLHPGTVLVATSAMPSPFFFGSVVLLYEHKRCSGSRGVILNMQSEERRITDWEKKLAPTIDNPSALRRIAHGTGGPVAQHDWMILNRCTCCTSLSLSLKDSHCSSQIYSDNQHKDWGQELLPGIFLGRDVLPVFLHAKEEPAIFTHQVLHGQAEWFAGQPCSEVKRGLWITKQNASEILFSNPPHELWHNLIRD